MKTLIYSKLYYGAESVDPEPIKESIYVKLLSFSGRILRVFNPEMSFVDLHLYCGQRLPKQMCKFYTSKVAFTLFNQSFQKRNF